MQREVDVLGLGQQVAPHGRLAHPLGPGQVHQVELGAPHGGGARLVSAQVHGEDAVGARGRLVHGGLWDEGED